MSRSALVSILLGTMLALTAAAAACSPAATAPAATTPAATTPAATSTADSGVSFVSETYTNSDYNFSVKYPKAWTSRKPDWEYQVFVAKVAAVNLPSISITVYPGEGLENQKTKVQAYYATRQVKDLKWLSNKDYTLKNGIKGELVDWTYIWPGNLRLESYAFAVDRNGKRITVGITSADGMMDYEFCNELFNTLQFK